MNFRLFLFTVFCLLQPGLQALSFLNFFQDKEKLASHTAQYQVDTEEPASKESELEENKEEYGWLPTIKRSFKIVAASKAISLPLICLAYKVGLLKTNQTQKPSRQIPIPLPWPLKFTAYACIGAPIIEEILFRGGLEKGIDYLVTKCSPTSNKDKKNTGYTATLITSLVFAALHYQEHCPQAVVDTFVGAILLSRAARKYGLKQSIAAHMLNNTIPVSLLHFLHYKGLIPSI